MKNEQMNSRYQALTNFMHTINDECNVFQDNPEPEHNDKNDVSTLKKYYHTYEINCK